MSEVLYREILGGGDDEENQFANGITVTLSYWDADNFRLRCHYILTARVMINREIVVDEDSLFRESFYMSHAQMIRKAIARFDELRALNPEADPEYLKKINDEFVDEPEP